MDFLFLLALLIYLAASILHALFLATGIDRISQGAFWATTTGFALHTILIALRWIGQGQFPMAHWLDSISFLAWAIILIYLGIAYLTRMRALGVFVVPAAFIAILIAYALPQDEPGLPGIFAELLAARPYHIDFPVLRCVHRGIRFWSHVSD